MQRRVVIVTTGEDAQALDTLEASFAWHLGLETVETFRLGVVSSLFAAYHNAARLIDDDEAWLIFAHQDVLPFHVSESTPVLVPALPESASWITPVFQSPRNWVRHAAELLEREDTGFLGVAGSCDLDLSCSWWNGHKLSGAVLHNVEGESPKINAYGPWGRVAVLDGVFLMTTGAAFRKMAPPRPTPDRFHFYDLELSLNADLAGLKNWTIPLLLVHGSGGATVESPQWRGDLSKFLERYSREVPFQVPFEPLPEIHS
ncbi:MAG: glycosyltransferase [bacterium]